MELLPAQLRAQLPKLYAQEGAHDPLVYIKFFFPAGGWTWFVTEGGECGDGDFLFFGLVVGCEKEWGYFSLGELREVCVGGLKVERDLYFTRKSLSRCLEDPGSGILKIIR